AISGYTTDRAILFEDLEPNTQYLFSVRGIISEDPLDASEWGGEMFTTADWPEVEAPVPATDVVVTENAATVSWSENADYLSFEIKYREGTSTEWLNVTGIKENSYTFTDLEANTVYLWAVKAACTHERETVWSNQAQFTTAEAGIDGIAADACTVSCSNGVLNIVNNGVEMRSINLFDTTGRNVATFDVNTTSNVTIPLNVVNGIYIVNIEATNGSSRSYRILR
ncbi:MAG: fibronectin type III domain-containing protein, partial [Muribaculaceae bacterium]|nr:fibronectin type III domain-containing protein [Muribaculaceae bacterium]